MTDYSKLIPVIPAGAVKQAGYPVSVWIDSHPGACAPQWFAASEDEAVAFGRRLSTLAPWMPGRWVITVNSDTGAQTSVLAKAGV